MTSLHLLSSYEANPSDEVSNVAADIYGIIYHGQDISLALVALLTSATRDVAPKASLSEIYHLITRSDATSYIVRTWF